MTDTIEEAAVAALAAGLHGTDIACVAAESFERECEIDHAAIAEAQLTALTPEAQDAMLLGFAMEEWSSEDLSDLYENYVKFTRTHPTGDWQVSLDIATANCPADGIGPTPLVAVRAAIKALKGADR